MTEKRNVPAVQSKSGALREAIEQGTGGIPKKGGYYEVGKGKFEPDAFRVQEEANDAKIKTRIVKAEQTETHALVIVEAERKDGVVTQGIVLHDYETIQAKKIMEMFKKTISGKPIFWGEKGQRRKIEPFMDPENPFRMNEHGQMVPNLTGLGMAKIMDEMLRFRDFSIRDAATKAMRIAQLKATNSDWRDYDEIEAEEEEVKTVNNEDEVKKRSQEDVDKWNKRDKKDASTEKEGDTEEKAHDKTVQEEETETKNTKQEGEKTLDTEILDNTDDLTREEIREMTVEEIGMWAVKKLRKEDKKITGGELGQILMDYNRRRWLSTKKFNEVKKWFINEYMSG